MKIYCIHRTPRTCIGQSCGIAKVRYIEILQTFLRQCTHKISKFSKKYIFKILKLLSLRVNILYPCIALKNFCKITIFLTFEMHPPPPCRWPQEWPKPFGVLPCVIHFHTLVLEFCFFEKLFIYRFFTFISRLCALANTLKPSGYFMYYPV
jgi:hypothetical protein